MEHFNKLSPAQLERLALLAEEMSEVQQVIGKILRHGYASYHPDTKIGNVEKLEQELGDVEAIVRMMAKAGDIDSIQIERWVQSKQARIGKYLHHQEEGI